MRVADDRRCCCRRLTGEHDAEVDGVGGWSAGEVVNPSSMQADVAMSNDSAASMLGRYFIVGMESMIVC